jgi:hypothetical protein
VRKVLAILLSAEIVAALLLGQCVHVHRRDQSRAVVAWLQNPTPETQLEVDRQRRITESQRIAFSAAVFGGLAAVTILVVRSYSRRRSGGSGSMQMMLS